MIAWSGLFSGTGIIANIIPGDAGASIRPGHSHTVLHQAPRLLKTGSLRQGVMYRYGKGYSVFNESTARNISIGD